MEIYFHEYTVIHVFNSPHGWNTWVFLIKNYKNSIGMILKHIYVEELVTISSDNFLWGCVYEYSHFKRVGINAYGPPSIPNDYEYSDINLNVLIEEIKRV